MNPLLSIIIPTYNEAGNIAGLIKYLQKNDPENNAEIIVCDGQSTDNTAAAAIECGVKVLVSPSRGRAAQMNFAAGYANAGILYFIHCDCFPPVSFINDITHVIRNGYRLGRYKTKFDSADLMLKINAWFTRFDWLICYGGDQTLFITKELFDRIGGFKNEMLIMEDYDIVIRARQFSKYKILNKDVLVSARKYQKNSWLKVQLANHHIVKMFKRGASQYEMLTKYRSMLDYG